MGYGCRVLILIVPAACAVAASCGEPGAVRGPGSAAPVIAPVAPAAEAFVRPIVLAAGPTGTPDVAPPASTAAVAQADAAAAGETFSQTVRPLLKQYCFACHSGAAAEGNVNLSAFESAEQAWRSPETWQRVWHALRHGDMPPEDPRPTAEQRQQLIAGVAQLLERAAREGGREPGHVVMRRLNQVEYNNTVLDLFGIYRPTRSSGGTQYDPQRGMPQQVRVLEFRDARQIVVPLPPDDVGYGFTNIGEVLSLPPYLLEKYLAASAQVVEQLVDQQGQSRSRMPQSSDPREGQRRFVAAFGRRALGRTLTE